MESPLSLTAPSRRVYNFSAKNHHHITSVNDTPPIDKFKARWRFDVQ